MRDSSRLGVRRAIIRPITLLLGLLLLWLPLPFGSVVPWSHTLLQIAAFALVATAALRWRGRGLSFLAVPAAALAAVALLGVLQTVAWPSGVARLLSPEHARLAAAAGSGSTTGVALSLAPTASLDAALAWLAMAALLVATASVGDKRADRRVLFLSVLASGLLQVLLGAPRVSQGTDEFWGVTVPGSASRLRGSFINPDHLALYLELALPIAFAWSWWALRRARDEEVVERRILLAAPPLLAWLTLFVGLAFTGSRGGLIAGVVGAAVQGLLLAARRRGRLLPASGILAATVGLGIVAMVGLQQGLGRWLATSQYELTWNGRLSIYAHSLELWQRFPLTGCGLASYREAFPLVQPAGLGAAFWHAHNDYVELLATGGLVAALLVAIALAAVVRRLLRVLTVAERSESRAGALAALGALGAVAVHSFFDFGLSMQANAATLVVMCAAAMAVPLGQRRRRPKLVLDARAEMDEAAAVELEEEPAVSGAS